MAVDSTLELFTTLYGWLFYNSIFEVLAATGIIYLPFIGILIDTVIRSYASEDAEDAGNTTLRIIEVEFFMAFFVAMIAIVPAIPLAAANLSFTPQALIGTPAQPNATAANSQSTYGGTISFVDYPNSVDLPVWWFLVLSFNSGFNRAVMEDVPPALNLREYTSDLRELKISDPEVQNELNDFFRDCFVEARSKFLSDRPDTIQVRDLLDEYGETDTDWIGSHVYLETSGYYDTLRSDVIRNGFPYSQLRDTEWDVTNAPLFGKPFCNEWWTDSTSGLAQKILDETDGIELVAASVELSWSADERKDAIIQAAMLNSPPRWTTRGYDFAYGNLTSFAGEADKGVWASVQNYAQQGIAAYGLSKESLSFAAFLRIFLEAAPMLQSLILMGLYSLLSFFVLMSRYKFSTLMTGTMVFFIVKFWTVLWFFSYWVDQNLILAFYPNPGDITTLFNIDLTVKRIILNFLTGMMYIVFPMLFSIYLTLAGVAAGRALDGSSTALAGNLARASRINPKIPKAPKLPKKTNK
jgi:hypothetical protein